MTPLKHSIDPMVDCVFKALLGAPENINLTINFLNAVLKPDVPIKDVDILNPYNEKEFHSDKLTIVDIKVKDTQERSYQIEVQLAVFTYLPDRMLYTWSDIYQSQLNSGDDFDQLKPVVSIWLLGENLLKQSSGYHHHFQAYDPVNKIRLSDHFSIHILELAKWQKKSDVLDKEDQWFYFFKNAKHWDQLPNELDNLEMRQAMQVLTRFSEKEKAYHLYQSRQNALRDEATKKHLLEKAERQREEAERRKEEAERQREEAERQREEAERQREEAERQREEAERQREEAECQREEAECRKEEADRQREEAEHRKEESDCLREESYRQREEVEQKMQDVMLEKERLIALLEKAGIDPNK